MKRSRFKAIAAWLHLWVGLVTGIIVFIISVTGCLLVFEEELFDYFHANLVEAPVTGPEKPVSELMNTAKKALGNEKKISMVRINEPGKSFVFSAMQINDSSAISLSYFSQFKYRNDVYVNPYTGKVLGVIDSQYEFFNVVEQLHRQLLLVKPVGSVVVGICVLLFLLMLITGFILWLPKNLKQLKKHLTVKWNSKWKRVNYDLHNTFGFYVLPVAMVIVITGLTWSFDWWEKGIYNLLGAPQKMDLLREPPQNATLAKPKGAGHLDKIVYTLRNRLNCNYKVIGINMGKKKANAIMAFVYLKHKTDGWRNMSYYYFDSRTGRMFDKLEHADKPLALKWRNSNKDIHTGSIYGLPTQILAFLASLVCASLPVTGFLIWLNKRKKTKKGKHKLQPLKPQLSLVNT